MKNNLIVREMFPCHTFVSKLDNHKGINKKIINYLHKIEKEEPSLAKSNYGGYHTHLGLHENENFTEVVELITYSINRLINDFYTKLKEKNAIFKTKDIVSMWGMINRKKDFNFRHTHPPLWLAGAYYVKLPKNNNEITFYDPLAVRQHQMFYINKIEMKVNEGEMIIFPAWLEHSVVPNTSNKERISLSFNLQDPLNPSYPKP